ncbi:MAG: tRNA 2-thiocytidine biosynthesis TtcA family protein [Clostridiales bacterium]|nr:tRNA 2-thiocytidine biosynthesis TtcA family protein [Clostridiales bacterium]
MLGYTRRAADDYKMIESNDKIAVGISGGKDSLTLLYSLANLRRFYPHQFEIEAITVDLGFGGFNSDNIKNLCSQLNVNYTVIHSSIAEIVFDIQKAKNPCSLCANLRRGAFNTAAVSLGCNKAAYAHHLDDVIETAMLSLIYEGRFHCFSPVTHLDESGITLIRPLIYLEECNIFGFKNLQNLPVEKNPCPADGHTRREYVKNLIKQLENENNGFKRRLFRAIVNGLPNWTKITVS